MVVNSGSTLNVLNNTSLTINGKATVAGKMDIHSAAMLDGTGTVTVSGALNILGSKGNAAQQAKVPVPITITDTGMVTVAPERATNDYMISEIIGGMPVKDESGNVIYQQRIGITALNAEGQEVKQGNEAFTDVKVALAAEGVAAVYLNSNENVYTLDTSATIGEGQTLYVMDGATLKITVDSQNMRLLNGSNGALEVQKGGTVNMPTVQGDEADWIGDDENSRINLTEGTLTYDFKENTLTLNGEATVPSNQTAYLHLTKTKAIKGVIANGSTLTVNGTLKAVNDSTLTIAEGGTLDVAEGLLTIGSTAKVNVSGTMNLPEMSKEQMGNDTAGEGMKGDIIINGGATVKYDKWTIVGGEDALITLSEDASATLNASEANAENSIIALRLNTGTANVVGGASDSTQANRLIAALTTPSDGLVPFDITIAEGAFLTIPEGKTLTLPKNSGLNAKGTVTVSGTLDVNGNITLTSTITLFGTEATVEFSTAVSADTNVTFKLENGATAEQIIDADDAEEGGGKINILGTSEMPDPEPEVVPVTGVTLNKNTASIKIGGTVNLIATVKPENAANKNVSWVSSNKAVATVEDGVVTAVAEGTAIITVTTEDGSHTAECDVTVTSASTDDKPTTPSRPSHGSGGGFGGGIGSPLPDAGTGTTPTQPAVNSFVSDTTSDFTVNGRYQFRITSTNGSKPNMTVSNSNFTVSLASQSGNDYFFVITAAGAPGSTSVVSVNGTALLTATVSGTVIPGGAVSDTTAPFTVADGGTYQFRITASSMPSFAAGSPSFTVEYAGQIGSDYFFKVHTVGQPGDGCGFYVNSSAAPVAVATIV